MKTFIQFKQLIWLVGILIVVLFGFILDIKPKYLQLQKTIYDRQDLQDKIIYAMNLIQEEDHFTEQLKYLKRYLAIYLRVNNNSMITSELLASVLEAGAQSGLEIQLLQPMPCKENSGVKVMPIRLSATGKFFQFAKFNLALMQNRNSLLIRKVIVRSSTATNLLQIDMKLNGYYIPVSEEEFVPVKTISQSNLQLNLQRDPFDSSAENFDQKSLLTLSLQQIKFVGYIGRDPNFSALVMLPNKKTVEVSSGALLGIEKAKILALNEREVILLLASQQLRLKYSL